MSKHCSWFQLRGNDGNDGNDPDEYNGGGKGFHPWPWPFDLPAWEQLFIHAG